MTTNIENLVFEGGGVKGSAYAGCVQVLDEQQMLAPIKRVAGTSAGSITAAMLAIGAGSAGLTESILDSQFNQFIYDRGWIFGDIYRVICRYGIHSGDSFVKILKGYIKKYTHDPNLTFGQLAKRVAEEPSKYKRLSVVASNITTQKADVFDSERTPDVPIWKAVRCSMSIPVLFEPFELNGSYYIDGGMSWIYPIDLYDKKEPDGGHIRNPATLGFYLEPQNQINDPGFFPPKLKINSLKSAAEAMFSFLYDTANSKHIHPDDKARTVFVDDLGVRSTDFEIRKSEIEKLIAAGRKATEDYLTALGRR